ncbi:MAG TPA: hypothetical protein VGO34_05360 [Alphaproteobacteria bacterium]|jgi:hypothetical protein
MDTKLTETGVSRRTLLGYGVAAVGLLIGTSLFGRAALAQQVVSTVFTEREKQVIRDYYRMQVEKARANRGKGGGVPPGLPRKDELAPGLARQIRVNAVLPSAIQKKPLPTDLERTLPVRAGTVRAIAGDQVMLVDGKNQIRDIIDIGDLLQRLYN